MKYRLSEKALVFSTASRTSQVLAELQASDEIHVGESVANGEGKWDAVKLADGRTGYISAKTKGRQIRSEPQAKTPSLAVASKEELQAFIQTRSYHYLPEWDALDPTLQRIVPGTFNWSAFFLNVYWMAYRRMYLYVVIVVAVLLVFYSILEFVFAVPQSAMNGVNIAMMYMIGRYGSSLYKKHVERKIRQIKATITPEYWPQAFRDKGGTSFWAPIPLIVLQMLSLYGMYVSIVERAGR
jgi:hypothetical protein